MGVGARIATPAALALLLGGCGWFGPASEPDVAPGPDVVDAPYACPVIGPDLVATPGSKDLPQGALAARFCLSDDAGGWLPPADDLTRDVDALVRVVNRQQVIGLAAPGARDTRNTGCSGPSAPSFSIVLRYRGGTRTISGNPLGCTGGLALQVGNGMRDQSMRVWHSYFRLLAAQRRRERPPTPPGSRVAACSGLTHGRRVTPLFDVRRLTSARLCPVDRESHPVGPASDLTPAQLRVLRTDLLTRHRRGHHSAGDDCGTWLGHRYYDIVAADQWGDRAALFGRCNGYAEVRAVPGLVMPIVRPLSATARMLQQLLEG
jgi:hypothetical protein